MNRITSRIAIALLTFVVGVAAVSLWFFSGRNGEERRIESAQTANPIKKVNELRDEKNDWEYNKSPKVKFVYIQTEEKHIEESLIETADDSLRYSTNVLIFYANGIWGRVWITLTRENIKWKIVEVSDDFIFLGKWNAVRNGEMEIKVEKCQSSNESIPDDGGTKLKYPFVEKWLVKNTFGHVESVLTNTYSTTFRLLNRSELSRSKLEELFSAPFQISSKESVQFRKCLDEDIRY